MPALNFFRIFPEQKNNLLTLLQQKGLECIDSKSFTENKVRYKLSLYFSSKPKKSFVKWITQLQVVFKIPDKKVNNFSAVMLIESMQLLYAVSYGIAHFFISRYADNDFGVNIASRIIKKYKMKSSKEFGGKTTKSILTYNQIDELAFDGGESVNYIKCIPFDENKWGKNISCGQSVQLRKRDFSPSNAHVLANMLEDTLNNEPIRKEIPRSLKINDKKKLEELIKKLISDMKSGNYLFSISSQQISGVEFIFADLFTYHLQLRSDEKELDENLSLEEANKIVKSFFSSDYVSFLNAKVEVREDGETIFIKPLICFIDYVDSINHYYIDDGEWYQFDTNYLRNLQSTVNLIPIKKNTEIRIFDEEKYEKWLKDNKKDRKKYYRERYLNILLEKDYKYQNYDRTPFKYEKITVEYADLIKDDEFIFVKIGKPQKLNYVIDQSLNALKILQRTGFILTVDGKNKSIKKMTLWLFIERTSNINKITDIRSLIFLMKLANWRKEILLSGLTPSIRIGYKRN